MSKKDFYKFQKQDASRWWCELKGRGIFEWDCGVGKGFVAAKIAAGLINNNNFKVLVLTSATLINDWKRNVAEFGIRMKEFGMKRGDDRCVISTYGKIKNIVSKYDLIIADEAHKIKAPTSRRGAAFRKIAQKTPYLLIMTGTLSNNVDPMEFLNYLWSINTDEIKEVLPKNITQYKQLYCSSFSRPGMTFTNYYSTKEGAVIINSLMKKYTLKRKLTEEIDMPKHVEIVKHLDSSIKMDEFIKQLAETYEIDVENNTYKPHVNHALMLDSGIDFTDKTVKNNVKLEFIQDTIEKADQVVIWYRWTAYGMYLHEKIPGSILINKDVTVPQRNKIVDSFKAGEFKVLIASLGTLAEGYNLQNAHVQIMTNIYYDSILHYQSISRLYRNLQKEIVVTYYLIGGKMEDAAYKMVQKKTAYKDAANYLYGILMKRFKEV